TKNQTPTFTGSAEKGATVTLFDGVNPVGTAVADPTTGDWSITLTTNMANGVHTMTAKATDVAGNTSVASSGLVVTIDIILPNIPSAPDLTDASDDGASNTDNITSITTPTFTGTADPLTKIELLADGIVVGSTTSSAGGAW